MSLRYAAMDIETTGLDIYEDEILQISFVDAKGTVIYDAYTKPEHHSEWPEAVNHISPESVKNKLTWQEVRPIVQAIIDNTDTLVTYNGKNFDIPFLIQKGIDFSRLGKYGKLKHADVAEIAMCTLGRGYNYEKNRPEYVRLQELGAEYGYNVPFHDSSFDAAVTMALYWKLKIGAMPNDNDS